MSWKNEAKEQREGTPPRVVILGAGFGGLSVALTLGKLKSSHRREHDLDIIVIDRNDYQLFTPDLYEIASASKAIADEKKLRESVCIDVRIGLGQQSVGFLQAVVEGINPQSKQVLTSKGEVDYDYLLIALGSESFYFGITGMEEHSIPFKTIQDAMTIRERIQQLMRTQEHTHVIICGAGAAGVELAAELRMMCEKEEFQKCFAMTIVEGRETILPQFDRRIQEKALRRLKKLGVKIKTNFVIAQAREGEIRSKSGETLTGHVIIWTGGIKANSVLESTGLQLTKRGQVPVRKTLQTREDDSIFVIGDAAEFEISPGVFCLQTAHEAIHEGPIAAQNIFRLIRKKEPLLAYKTKDEGFVITLGGRHGLVILPGGMVIGGAAGWFVRKYIDFRHFRSVLPFMQACSVWFQGARLMEKND